MNQRLINWQRGLDSTAIKEYSSLRRSLQRNRGFGLFFVQCSPAVGTNIVGEISKDVKQRKITTLKFDRPIDSLYNEIAKIPDIENIDILFISGLEHSLLAYEEYTFGNSETHTNSKERYFRSKRGIPRFLGYLNLQRDRFKRDFPLSIVFLVPIFGIQYLIERTPDFFDWRSGFFRFLPEKDSVIHLNYPNYEKVIQEDINKIKTELLDTTTLAQELELDSNEYLKMLCKKSFLAIICKRYQKALKLLDKIIDLGENNGWTWNSRGNVLCNLQRYKEAVLSFDRCLEINPDEDSAWIYRGFALGKLKRYEEAISSYNKSLAINPDEDIAWFLRGNDLGRLERYEEAINSYDKCLVINPDEDTTWFNRGSALGQLERYEEAVASYDKGLAINPDQDLAWYDRACCLALLNQTELAIESWTKAINLNPKWLESAKTNSDFDSIRNDKRFQSLINSPREQSQ